MFLLTCLSTHIQFHRVLDTRTHHAPLELRYNASRCFLETRAQPYMLIDKVNRTLFWSARPTEITTNIASDSRAAKAGAREKIVDDEWVL